MTDIQKIADAIRRAITQAKRQWDELDYATQMKYVKAAREALIQNARNKRSPRQPEGYSAGATVTPNEPDALTYPQNNCG